MGSNQEKKNNNNGTINLKVPLIISLCANFILLVCVVVLAVIMATLSLNASVSTQSSDSSTTAATTQAESSTTDSDDTEEEDTYYFTDYEDNTIEVYAYNAYIYGEYTCTGDATVWTFSYDSTTGLTTVVVTESDGTELGSYSVYFYLTTDGTSLVCNILDDENTSVSLIYYLITVLDDEDNNEAIGLYFVSAIEEDSGFLLYTSDYYNQHVNEDGTFDFATSEDTEASAD